MKEELKYPKVFAIMEIKNKSYFNQSGLIDVIGYIVSPSFLVAKTTSYQKNGNKKDKYNVVFPRNVENIIYDIVDLEEITPKYNYDFEIANATEVDFISCDYEEAISRRNELIKENIIGEIALCYREEEYKEKVKEQIEKINYWQESLNKFEPKEQVKKLTKTFI